MIADIVEEVQVKTSKRSEGLLFAADTFLQKLISGFASILPGIFLELVAFPPKADPKTLDPQIMRDLFKVYLPVLTVLHLVAFYFFWSYRITRAQHVENVKRLAEEYALTKVGVAAEFAGAQLPPAPGAVKVAPGE